MRDKQKTGVSRREFVKTAVMGTVASSLAASGFPSIVPASVLKGNGQIAMKLKRKVYWNPQKERFKNDDAANNMLSRAQRWPYVIPAHRV